jgi:membrane protease YdiL (CAAX protease family)
MSPRRVASLIFLLVSCAPLTAFAQPLDLPAVQTSSGDTTNDDTADDDTANAPPRGARWTRGQSVGLGLVSAAFGLGSLGVDRLPGPGLFGLAPHSYYQYGTEVGASVPLAVVAPSTGAQVGGLQLAFIGGAIALREAQERNGDLAPYTDAAEAFALHQGLYAAYATYRETRARGDSSEWNDAWRPWGAGELIVGPVQWRNLRRPIVNVPLMIETSALGIMAAGYYGSGNAAPSTAARDTALALPLAWDAGVTEEALFRGFIYEELKLSLSRPLAHLVDMALFTGAHVPGELNRGWSATDIAAGLVSRAVFSLLAEFAYDDSGLPESVALHALWDTVALVGAAWTGHDYLKGALIGSAGTVTGTAQPIAFVVPLLSGTW